MNDPNLLEYDNQHIYPGQQDANAWNNKGNTLSRLGRSKEAIAAFYTFIKLAPPEIRDLIVDVKNKELTDGYFKIK
jgi:tetratricopeptide (TPR) repeat protein